MGIHFLGALSAVSPWTPCTLGDKCRGARCRSSEGGSLDTGKSQQLPATGCLVNFGQAFPKPRVCHPGEDRQQKQGLADEWKQTLSRSRFSPTYSLSIFPFTIPRPSPVVSTSVLSLLSSLPSSLHSRAVQSRPSLPLRLHRHRCYSPSSHTNTLVSPLQ